MATTRLMPLHIGEGRSFSTAIEDIIDYVENPEKTDYGKLIYGFECDTRTADAEFTLTLLSFNKGGHGKCCRGQNTGLDIAGHIKEIQTP